MGSVVFCGQNCQQIEQTTAADWLTPGRVVKNVADLPNYVDPMTIDDQFERVKYMFPFYRTDLNTFEQKLAMIGSEEQRVNELKTCFINIDDIRRAFCVSPAWRSLWDNVDALLRSFVFKELVVTSTVKGLNYKLGEEKWSDYTSKLELAILGLLWCPGTQEEKAKYFALLSDPAGSDTITHQSGEMKFIFKKLFYFSIDMAAKYSQIKAQMECAMRDDIQRKTGRSSGISGRRDSSSSSSDSGDGSANPSRQELEFKPQISKHDVQQMIRDEETYLDNFYRDCFAELAFPYGQSHMNTKQFIEVLNQDSFGFLFDAKLLKDRFMNYASHLQTPTQTIITPGQTVIRSYSPNVITGSNLAHQVNEKRQIMHAQNVVNRFTQQVRTTNRRRRDSVSSSSSSSSSDSDDGRIRQDTQGRFSTYLAANNVNQSGIQNVGSYVSTAQKYNTANVAHVDNVERVSLGGGSHWQGLGNRISQTGLNHGESRIVSNHGYQTNLGTAHGSAVTFGEGSRVHHDTNPMRVSSSGQNAFSNVVSRVVIGLDGQRREIGAEEYEARQGVQDRIAGAVRHGYEGATYAGSHGNGQVVHSGMQQYFKSSVGNGYDQQANAAKEIAEAELATKIANKEEYERQAVARELEEAKRRRDAGLIDRQHQSLISEQKALEEAKQKFQMDQQIRELERKLATETRQADEARARAKIERLEAAVAQNEAQPKRREYKLISLETDRGTVHRDGGSLKYLDKMNNSSNFGSDTSQDEQLRYR